MSVYINMYLLILCITSYLTKMGDDADADVDDVGEKKKYNKKCVYIYFTT